MSHTQLQRGAHNLKRQMKNSVCVYGVGGGGRDINNTHGFISGTEMAESLCPLVH